MDSPSKFVAKDSVSNDSSAQHEAKQWPNIATSLAADRRDVIEGHTVIFAASFFMTALLENIPSRKHHGPGKPATTVDLVSAISWIIAFTGTFVCSVVPIYYYEKSRCRTFLFLLMVTLYIFGLAAWGAELN